MTGVAFGWRWMLAAPIESRYTRGSHGADFLQPGGRRHAWLDGDEPPVTCYVPEALRQSVRPDPNACTPYLHSCARVLEHD